MPLSAAGGTVVVVEVRLHRRTGVKAQDAEPLGFLVGNVVSVAQPLEFVDMM